MKEQNNIIDITNLLEYKRQFELAECPYLFAEEWLRTQHKGKKPIPIFTGANEARKRRVMRMIERGKQ